MSKQTLESTLMKLMNVVDNQLYKDELDTLLKEIISQHTEDAARIYVDAIEYIGEMVQDDAIRRVLVEHALLSNRDESYTEDYVEDLIRRWMEMYAS